VDAEAVAPAERSGLSFRSKILALLVLLIAATQLSTYAVVQLATDASVRAQLAHDLDVGERVWGRFHQARSRQLLDSLSVLAADFGFKEAVASADAATLESALANHAARMGAHAALLASPDGRLLAALAPGTAAAQEAALAPLLQDAARDGVASGVVLLGDRPVLLAVVPVRAPVQIAWVAVGSALGQEVAREYQALTGLDASFVRSGRDGRISLAATTLAEPVARAVAAWQPAQFRAGATPPRVDDLGQWRSVALSRGEGERVHVLLHAPVARAQAPFAALRSNILGLSAAAAALALLVAGVAGGSVSRPLAQLAAAASRIEQGDYSRPVAAAGKGEFGRLARAFGRMQQGIALREERIVHQALHDGLTGLPNRTHALSALEAAMDRARRGGGCCTVLMLDLDRFKEINDSLGHAFGDQVLVEVARRLRAAVRPQDGVARLGGDEFLVLLQDVGAEQALRHGRELGALLHQPVTLADARVALDVSVGAASFPLHAADATTLLRRVEIAMYEAKARRAGAALYQAGHDEIHLRQLALIAGLRHAIERGELSVVFQPKIELSSGEVRHAEALLRWTHPEFGPVRPDEFIPLAERSGHVHALSRFVLDEALAQLRAWEGEGLVLGVAVNLSAMDLMDGDLPDFVHDGLRRHRLAPSRLILEVTESALMRDVDYAIGVLQRLRQGGVRIAIDDFGTGYSSLSQLRRLPVDELKIDKSFVLQLAQQEDDAVIVRATIDLGHHLGLRVIAEGVEDAHSLALLRGYRCDMAQGYLFSPPLLAAGFVAWCRQHASQRQPA
jgi:diguanylate cyclase (GGDEF)-like protein